MYPSSKIHFDALLGGTLNLVQGPKVVRAGPDLTGINKSSQKFRQSTFLLVLEWLFPPRRDVCIEKIYNTLKHS